MANSNINVVVTGLPNTGLSVQMGGSVTPQITIKNDALLAGQLSGPTQLKQLTDVVLADTTSGDTLVYNSTNQTFVLQSANNLNITNVDGGGF
jgi:hypothetical protein